jgi:hypothetical protein
MLPARKLQDRGVGRKIGLFRPVSRNLNLALPNLILYKRGLIGIQPAPWRRAVLEVDDAFANT